jgi:hypothetical protein
MAFLFGSVKLLTWQLLAGIGLRILSGNKG